MEIPRHWRLKAQRYRLEGSVCSICGQFIFPPRPICVQCHYAIQLVRIAGEGFPILPTMVGSTQIELHVRYQITERMTG
jgi:uncharacterized OB-fold protein